MIDDEHDPPTVETDDETTKRLRPSEELSQSIPGFRLLQKLGAGGMGEVFEVEQLEPVRRRVALKLIKRGMESKEVLARFDGERQALALMSHPNIAQVYDAGTTTDGRPYFVMEFVQGIPVTQYCDTNRLTTAERLELFSQICDGVQHAHQKGVIHRDIKPSNVLVKIQDSKPVPKIIDFGVAKAIAQRLTEQTLFTAIGEFIGTPEYMSPEQAEMTELDIDTRTDVYSLGVVLYEMLVGAQPFDGGELRRAGFDEMRRRIREEEPPKPSVRLSGLGEQSTTAAANRRIEPSILARQLHGDLDWITMKALEKDRTRRYGSPGELAADIGRHLRNEPVLAGPPSTTYRVRKFVRRHTIGVAASALVVLALILGIAGTTVGMLRARTAEQAASREAETARQVSNFLTGLFEVSDPSRSRGETITAREILDRGAERIGKELAENPLVRARLMNTIGDVYWKLGLYEEARPLLEDALETRQTLLGDRHEEVAESLHGLGILLNYMGQREEAQQLYEEALKTAEAVHGPDHLRVATTLNSLGNLLLKLGDYEGASARYERALAIREHTLGEEHSLTIATIENLGVLATNKGDFQSARELFERNLVLKRKTLEPDDLALAVSLNNLATLLTQLGDYEAARPMLVEALEIRERVLGPDHPEVGSTVQNLAMTDHQAGNLESARELYERALAMLEESVGSDHPRLSFPMANLAELFRYQGELEKAKKLHERALEIRLAGFGPENPYVANSLQNLGLIDEASGDREEALRKLTRAVEIFEASVPPGHPWLGGAVADLAGIHLADGDEVEARQRFEQAAEILDDDPVIWYKLACIRAQSGDEAAALDGLDRAVDLGFADLGQIESDPDLDSLRGEERFEALVGRLHTSDPTD